MIVAGDIVTLKSGGPKMTVEEISFFGKTASLRYWNEASCSQYFDWQVINVAALEKVV